MSEEMMRHGAISWFELMTDDALAAKEFYTKLFGWEWDKFPTDDEEPYWVIKVGGKGIGGIMKKPAQAKAMNAPNYWGAYVTVDDVDKTAAAAAELGAQVIVPPTDIPRVGRFCVILDPQGATIAAITYAQMD